MDLSYVNYYKYFSLVPANKSLSSLFIKIIYGIFLLSLFRNLNTVRAINQELGEPVDRFVLMARWLVSLTRVLFGLNDCPFARWHAHASFVHFYFFSVKQTHSKTYQKQNQTGLYQPFVPRAVKVIVSSLVGGSKKVYYQSYSTRACFFFYSV